MIHFVTRAAVCVISTALVGASSSGSTVPEGAVQEANTTKPLTRAQIIAMTPEDADNSMLLNDPGYEACASNPSDSKCQNAMTKQLAVMSQTHQDIVSDLNNIAIQLNAIEGQQTDGLKKIDTINSAIYGSGSEDNIGLMNSLQKVAISLQDIQSTVRDQTTDIANKSSTVRQATDAKLKNIQQIMDKKLIDVEGQINKLLNDQASAQQTAVVNAATNMLQATTNAAQASQANQENINKAKVALSDAVDEFETSAKAELATVAQETATNVQTLGAIQDGAKQSLDEMKTKLTTEAKSAVTSALDDSQKLLASNVQSTVATLNDVKNEGFKELAEASTSLKAEVAQSQSEIQAQLDASKNKMQQTNEENKKGIAGLSDTASQGVKALSTAQEASGAKLLEDAKKTQGETNTVNAAIKDYEKTGRDAVAGLENKVNGLVGPLQESAGAKLAAQGKMSGDELMNLNKMIADMFKGISSDGNEALGQLSAYLSDIRGRAGDDAKFQDGALADTQNAIGAAADLAQGKLNLQKDKSNQNLRALTALLGGSMDETAETLSEITSANGAKQRNIQSRYQQEIANQQATLGRRVSDAKMAQQQEFNGLQSDQAKKSHELAVMIADLMSVLENLETASKASGSDLANLGSSVSATSGDADNEIARLLKLVENSESAASAGASGASAQLKFALSGMGDQLTKSLKSYAGQFNGDLSAAIAKLTGMSDETLAQLRVSGETQTAASSDAETLSKKLLTDLGQLAASGQSQSEALANLFRSQAMQGALARQVKLKEISDGAQGKMGDLEKKVQAMIDQQSGGLAATTSESVSNEQSRLSQLVDSLRAQQIGATRLASQTQGALSNVEKWTSDMYGQINSAEDKVGKSRQTQLNILQALQGELNDWSGSVDRNISEAKQQLQDGLAMIPNITATKAADTERIFAASNDNMKAYLSKLKEAFDKMRATESAYVRQQSLRRLSTLMGIDRASLDNSNVLMQLLGVSDLSQIGDEQQIATVLAGLAEGISQLQGKDDAAFQALKDRVMHLDSNSKGLFGQLMNKAGGSLATLYQKYAEDQHALQATIEAAADKDRLRAEALEDSLNGMLGSIRNGTLVLNGQLANDRKDIYGIEGSVRQLGDESMIALNRLLHSVEGQSSSADSALAAAQRVNADRVASVRDVVISFVRAMQEYVDGSRSGFDDIHSKLDAYKNFLDQKLSVSDSYMLNMAQSTQSQLSATAELAQALQSRIEAFNARAKQQLFHVEEERSAIESRHEEELTQLRAKLQKVTQQVSDDQESMSKQVDGWLAQEDGDLGFGVAEGHSKTASRDAPEIVVARTVPDWARDDSSFVQMKSINKHDAVVEDLKRNLRAIHKEAASIGMMV